MWEILFFTEKAPSHVQVLDGSPDHLVLQRHLGW